MVFVCTVPLPRNPVVGRYRGPRQHRESTLSFRAPTLDPRTSDRRSALALASRCVVVRRAMAPCRQRNRSRAATKVGVCMLAPTLGVCVLTGTPHTGCWTLRESRVTDAATFNRIGLMRKPAANEGSRRRRRERCRELGVTGDVTRAIVVAHEGPTAPAVGGALSTWGGRRPLAPRTPHRPRRRCGRRAAHASRCRSRPARPADLPRARRCPCRWPGTRARGAGVCP